MAYFTNTKRLHATIFALLLSLISPLAICWTDEVNLYKEVGKNQHGYLLACMSFIIDNGPVAINGESRFEDRFRVRGLDRDKLHFFWIIVNGGYRGIYESYMHYCIKEYKERFANAGSSALDADLKATAYIYAPIIQKIDANLTGQCSIIIRDGSVDSQTREACSYYMRSNR